MLAMVSLLVVTVEHCIEILEILVSNDCFRFLRLLIGVRGWSVVEDGEYADNASL